MNELEIALRMLGKFLVTQLRAELVSQNRNVTSKLYNSIDSEVRNTLVGLRLDVRYEEYGVYLNQGRKAGGKRVPIDVLIEWVKRRNFATEAKQVKSIAFAIQTKIFKEGITPSKFQDVVLKRNAAFIATTVTKGATGTIEAFISDLVNNIQTKINAV